MGKCIPPYTANFSRGVRGSDRRRQGLITQITPPNPMQNERRAAPTFCIYAEQRIQYFIKQYCYLPPHHGIAPTPPTGCRRRIPCRSARQRLAKSLAVGGKTPPASWRSHAHSTLTPPTLSTGCRGCAPFGARGSASHPPRLPEATLRLRPRAAAYSQSTR